MRPGRSGAATVMVTVENSPAAETDTSGTPDAATETASARCSSEIGDGSGTDGVRHGGILGTRLHGPVLAKNPALADAILARAFGRPVAPDTEASRMADAAAATLRARVPVR